MQTENEGKKRKCKHDKIACSICSATTEQIREEGRQEVIRELDKIITPRLFDSFKCSNCNKGGCDDGRAHDRQLIQHIKRELEKLKGAK